jgi:CRISPR system Cascade subunit CasA
VLLIASALARGQGKTEGLHERVLTLSGSIRRRLREPDARAKLGRRAEERVASAQTMGSKVLFPALVRLGLTERKEFDSRVDELFFEHLFATLDQEDEPARLSWERQLQDTAREELERAISRCALPSARRFKVVSEAERMLAGCLRKNFPDVQAAGSATEGVSS